MDSESRRAASQTASAPKPRSIRLTPYGWYMSGHLFWFLLSGIQMVMIPALGLYVLDVEPRELGWAQTASLIPQLLLMLLGGVAAERNDSRIILARAQFLAIFPPLFLALSLWLGGLTYAVYVLCAAAMGALTAFVLPSRDTLLTRIASGEIQKTVTFAMTLQFVGMLCGIGLMIYAPVIGFLPLIVLQCFLAALCCFVALKIPRQAPPTRHNGSTRRYEIGEAIRLVWKNKDIVAVTLLMASIGIFYIGAFLVLVPLMTKNFYGGGADSLGVVQILFWIGTILVTLAMSRRGVIIHRGRLMTAAILAGAGVLALFSLETPFWVFCAGIFVWGMGAGVSMSMTRTVVQEEAPETHRARFLAIYSLSFMGGAPVGTYIMGELAQNLPLREVVLFPVVGMLLAMAALLTLTPLWRIRAVTP